MKLKRIISAALCAALAASMAACGAPADTSASTPVQQSVSVSVPAAPTEVPTLTMLTFTEWYKDGWKALENYINENSDELGFSFMLIEEIDECPGQAAAPGLSME